jgi:hypothetical protein
MNPRLLIRGIITPLIKNYIKKNPKVIYPKEAALALENTLKKAVEKEAPGYSFSSLKLHHSPGSISNPKGNIIQRPTTMFNEIFTDLHPQRMVGDKFSTKADIRTVLGGFMKKKPKFVFGGNEKSVATELNSAYQKLNPRNPSLLTAEGKASTSFREVWKDLGLPVYTAEERGKLVAAKNLAAPMRIDHRVHHPNLDAFTKQFLRRSHSSLDEGSSEFKGISEMIEQAIRRDNSKAYLDIRHGAGKNKEIKIANLRENLLKNVQDEKFMQKYYDEVYPYRNKAADYVNLADESFGADLTRYQDEVYNYMRTRGMTDESIKKMFPSFFKTVGHKPGVSASYLDFLKTGNPASLEMWQAAAKPRMWEPEIGAVNKMKDVTDRIMFGGLQKEGLQYPSQLKGIDEMRRLYGDVGIESLIRGKPIGEGFDLAKQADFMAKQTGRGHNIFTGPFGHSPNDWAKLKREWMNMLLRGDRTYKDVLGFKKGGLVSLGSRILKKLAKKLSRQEMKMMMGQ